MLTSRQRPALFPLPPCEADLLRHYTLGEEDLQHIGGRRPRVVIPRTGLTPKDSCSQAMRSPTIPVRFSFA